MFFKSPYPFLYAPPAEPEFQVLPGEPDVNIEMPEIPELETPEVLPDLNNNMELLHEDQVPEENDKSGVPDSKLKEAEGSEE
jgi:hypothetical protein